MAAPEETGARRLAADGHELELPLMAVLGLGVVAATLVGAATYVALAAGHTAAALGFLAAVGLFGATVAVFESGRRLGARHGR